MRVRFPVARHFYSLIFAYAQYAQQVVRGRPSKRHGVMAGVLALH